MVNIKIGKTHRSALLASDDPVVMRIGSTVAMSFFMTDGRTVRIEMTPEVAELMALSLGRMARL